VNEEQLKQEKHIMAKKPTHRIRVGRVIASIWERDGEKGPRHFATFEHFYQVDNDWKYSDCFGVDDLLALSKAADQAHTWISRQLKQTQPTL
jgi:hypothetical protein